MAIDAKDLRIGNWVRLGKNNEQVYQILFDLRNGHSVNNRDYVMDFFEPIPLTTEILLKCGFEKGWVWNLDLWEGCKLLYYEKDHFANDNDDLTVWQIAQSQDTFDIPEIKYLHQLQNFVYAFSQKELEINL